MQASYSTVVFNTKFNDVSVGSYQTFMQSLRRELSSGITSYDIPLLRKKSEAIKDKQFVYVRLENQSFKITFAVSTLNCYMIAYQVDAEKRCYFFKEAPPEAKTLLFKESTRRVNVNLSTNYNNLGNRENYNLGFKSLDNSLEAFKRFDSENPTNELRRILIVVSQMVAEAARSKYIQQKIEWKGFDSGFFPKGDILSYENKWEDLSKAIQNSKDGSFPKIQLQNEDYSARYVSKVAEVKNDMALLLNIAA
ncbi:ribosome-inactivating protein cucurmosin-like [Cannabis sativa]|uniref:ribosome-inactivating protein cucurmosin-like n=1 Tax=Cannabis sativa TaxID=3483 RepID=UPI0029CA4421|nr:ribosome-inactivating protein cucurmosin-like [Cannabis sativa]